MSTSKSPSTLPAPDYDAIEAAMMETERGRWFLTEYARRNRNSDTSVLLDAIGQLQASITPSETEIPIDKFRMDLLEMSQAIANTHQEIAALRPADGDSTQFIEATEELDAIVRAAENATNDILESAEEIQETAWLMREQGADSDACDRLDVKATDIYTACSFQDLTGQRTSKVVSVLRFLEDRVNAMVDIWGLTDASVTPAKVEKSEPERPDAHLLNGPQHEEHALQQDDIDGMMFESGSSKEAAAPAPALTAEPDIAADIPAELPAEPDEAGLTSDAQNMLNQLAQSASVDEVSQSETAPVTAEETQSPEPQLQESQLQEAQSQEPQYQETPPPQEPALQETQCQGIDSEIIQPAAAEQENTSQAERGPDQPPEAADDPDDLLASGDVTASSSSAAEPGDPAAKLAYTPAGNSDVIAEEDFSQPDPLTLPALSANSRAALFC